MTALEAVLALVAKVDAGWEAHGAELRKDSVCHENVFHLWAQTKEKEELLAELAVDLIRTHGPAMLAMERDGELRQKICDLFGCGSEARSDSILLTNIRNVKNFADKLHAVEQTFFMVPGEPDEDYPEDGPSDECLLNRWGTNTEEYVEQFRTALSAIGKVGS